MFSGGEGALRVTAGAAPVALSRPALLSMFDKIVELISLGDMHSPHLIHSRIELLIRHAQYTAPRNEVLEVLKKLYTGLYCYPGDRTFIKSHPEVEGYVREFLDVAARRGIEPALVDMTRQTLATPAGQFRPPAPATTSETLRSAGETLCRGRWHQLRDVGVRLATTARQALDLARGVASRADRKSVVSAGEGAGAAAASAKLIASNPGTVVQNVANAIRASRTVATVAKHPVAAAVIGGTIAAGVAHLSGMDASENPVVRGLGANIFGHLHNAGIWSMRESSFGKFVRGMFS